MPTYNEKGNVEKVIPQIFEISKNNLNWEIHVVVIDSNSPDKTQDSILKLINKYSRLHLIKTKKEGLGKAYSEGFKIALEKFSPYLLFEMDADLSHNPKEIPVFLKAIENGADFVIGSRYMKGGSIPSDWGLHRKILSVCGNLFVRLGFMKLSITDWTGGYRAIKSWVIKNSLDHIQKYSGYVFQIALLDFAVKNKARIVEIPIQFKERKIGVSKINSSNYIINIFSYVLNNSAFIKFAIVGLIGFAIDFGLSYFLIEKNHTVIWTATLISTETAIISNFVLNNFWSFSHKKLDLKVSNYTKSFVKFNLVSSGSILIQTIGVQLLTNILGRKFWYIYKTLIIAFIVIPYSYILYNKFIWREK